MNKKTVLIGVTGSIAAYKMADVVSDLTKRGYNVETILTKNATKIISPTVFSTLSGNKCITKTFDSTIDYKVEHISLAKKADLLLIAPATANIIAKIAYGLADDMLSTTVLACDCPKLIAPAMNKNMFLNPVVQNNLKILKEYGWKIIKPISGVLACKDEGIGKLAKPNTIVEHILNEIEMSKDLKGLKVLVTAGPTQESLDPVRYITNHSSGKMGYALATMFNRRGAEVTLISGPTSLDVPLDVNFIPIKSAQEMFEAVKENSKQQDIIIKAAAVADFTPEDYQDHKIKKKENKKVIKLKNTQDILAYLGEHKKPNQFLCGFSMETENVLKNSQEKLSNKNLDMICANSLNQTGAGFKSDTNIITIITENNSIQLGKLSKIDTANKIIDFIKENYKKV